ncbi:Major facilitator superfamily domain, general substrate transporter [Metarhizium album ARSEF 1941]|uniref:Major facilitator superfamily domain, general substrate transporter n=1 Tax=Metarhizium album (strain ARSEF 1941) TaxID=1081103 RepID=A0A0B2WMH0_METAS|nr:Major facilitator superfamily domain, general substrate transporter [Metarhizium album ARSEF 1941]KHN94687.1 Major facilitator superfamily domain, general substrate transporter [Metarhizium album ARSEF 1941]
MAQYSTNKEPIKASHLELGLVGGLSISQALLVSPIVTMVRRRIGTRWTLLIGTLLLFTSLLAASFASKVWHLVLTQGLCFGWGMGFAYVTASALLPPWFSSRRSLAVGLATAGSGIGGSMYSLVADRVIRAWGLGWAYRVLAFAALSANLPASFLVRDLHPKPRDVAPGGIRSSSFDPRDFGRVEVFLIVAWGFATELGYIILLYSLPVYAASVGLTPAQGSAANALLNLGLAVGRPPLGYFSDTFGRISVAGVTTLLCAVFCFALWIPAQSFAPLLVFALVAGMLCGTFWCVITPVLVEVVGIAKFANTFGVICIGLVVPTTFAEPIAMRLVRGNANSNRAFIQAQLFAGLMFLVGSLCLWLLRCWKIFTDAERRGESVTALERQHRHWASWVSPQMLFSTQRV